MVTHAVVDELLSQSAFFIYLPILPNCQHFVASVGDRSRYRSIIYTFPASHLSLSEFNQNTMGLLSANLFPVDMNNISA